MQSELVLIASPLGIKRHAVRRHGIKVIGIPGAKGVIIPAQEGKAIQNRFEIIGFPADVRLKVDVVSRGKVGTGCRVVGQRIHATVYESTVTVGDVVLVTSVANVQIVIGGTRPTAGSII